MQRENLEIMREGFNGGKIEKKRNKKTKNKNIRNKK